MEVSFSEANPDGFYTREYPTNTFVTRQPKLMDPLDKRYVMNSFSIYL